jgi:hypothetical protein
MCQFLKRAAGGTIRPDALVSVWRQVVSVCHGREDMVTTFDWSGFFGKTGYVKALVKEESDSDETLATEYGGVARASQRRKRSVSCFWSNDFICCCNDIDFIICMLLQ